MRFETYTEGKERLKIEADHFILVDGRFSKKGNLHMRLVLDGHKMSTSLPTGQNLKSLYGDLN